MVKGIRSVKGITLTEAMVGTLILTMFVGAIFLLYTTQIGHIRMAKRRTQAYLTAQSMIEELRSLPYNDGLLDTSGYPITRSIPIDFGPAGTDITTADFTIGIAAVDALDPGKYITVDMAIPNFNGGIDNETLETVYFEYR